MNNPINPSSHHNPEPSHSQGNSAGDASPVEQASSKTIPPGLSIITSSESAIAGITENLRNQRTGRVARLPKLIRDKVNLLILDGATYAEILTTLGEDGHLLNEDNLGNWKQGGYQDWLKAQYVLAEMRIRQENATELLQQNEGTTLHEATNKIATSQIWEALRSMGPSSLQSALEKNPDNYVRVLNALTRLTAGAITCEHLRIEQLQRKASLDPAKADPASRAITPATLARIEKELNLL